VLVRSRTPRPRPKLSPREIRERSAN